MKTYTLKTRNWTEWVFLYLIIPIAFVIVPALIAILDIIPVIFKTPEEKEVSVKLAKPLLKDLEGKVHAILLQGKISYDSKKERLTYKGVMCEQDRNILSNLSKDNSYKEAIKVLNDLSNNSKAPIRQCWITIKSSHFDPLYLARGFIALNNACALLPLIFFTSAILSLIISSKWPSRLRQCFFGLSLGLSIGLLLGLLFFFILYEITIVIWVLLVLYFLSLSLSLLSCGLAFLIPRLCRWSIIQSCWLAFLIPRIQYCHRSFYIANRYFMIYIYLRHPIAFLAGLVYCIIIHLYLCWSIANPDTLKLHFSGFLALQLFVIWSSSLALWLGPFVAAWLHIFGKGFIDEYYRRTLATNISDLKKHRVLLGYGGLGQGVLKELFERESSSPSVEPLLDPADMSSIKYLLKDMVVVDEDERLFDHVFVDPSFEKIGIAKTKYREINRRLIFSEEELWVPAIIGNITNESVDDYSKLAHCKFFIDAVKGYEETLRIAKVAHDNPEMKGIITVADSTQMEFLFPRYSGHGVFFTYVTQQQGISLGEVVYPAMVRVGRLPGKEKPKILVFTDDIRQTHYMMETLVQELKMGDKLKEYDWYSIDGTCRQYNLEITVCGDSEEIESACHPRDPQPVGTPNFGLDVRVWNECIERCSKPKYAEPPHPIYVKSSVILEHPHLMLMEKMLRFHCIKPDIVVISFLEASSILKTLRGWVGAFQRNENLFLNNSGQKYKPVIIVGSLGEEEREVRDVLFYYDALPPDAMQGRYPVQAIDSRVNLYKDSIDQMGAIAEALSRKKPKKEPAIGIHMMLQNRAGTTPGILAALGGVRRKVQRMDWQQLSFHYGRYYNCPFGAKQPDHNYFFFAGDVILEDGAAPQPENPSDWSDRIQSILLSVPDPKQAKDIANTIEGLLGYYVSQGCAFGNCENIKKEEEEKINECQFQATCGPDAFRREIYNLIEHRPYFETFAPEAVKGEFDRFCFNPNFNEAIRNKDFPPRGRPLAKLYLCCRHGDTPGALAIALNTLLGKIYTPDPNIKEVFNITFLTNYFTFNPKVMYEAIFGYLTRNKSCRNNLNEGVIERILICPISDTKPCNNSWRGYANDLRNYLGGEYIIQPPGATNNNNILIYRNGYQPCKIRKERTEDHDTRCVPDAGCDICRKHWYTGGHDYGWFPQPR